MTSFAERVAEDRRAALLRILEAAEGHSLNEDILVRELMRLRLGVVTQDDMRGLLTWLERQGLVAVEQLAGASTHGALWIAQATRAGRDVARGAKHPGVAQPL
jgi:hypothetical protein